MPELVRYSDIAIGNEEDADKVFGIKAPDADVSAGKVEAEGYKYVCAALAERFPNLSAIAFTLRGSLSASHNTWSGVLWHKGAFYSAPVYDIVHIVDRVGGGDAFGAGLIYGLRTHPPPPPNPPPPPGFGPPPPPAIISVYETDPSHCAFFEIDGLTKWWRGTP